MTLREHLEAIIVRGYCPTKDEDRADAVAALAILDASGLWPQHHVWTNGEVHHVKQTHRLIPDQQVAP